jgi:hypothetical protein
MSKYRKIQKNKGDELGAQSAICNVILINILFVRICFSFNVFWYVKNIRWSWYSIKDQFYKFEFKVIAKNNLKNNDHKK